MRQLILLFPFLLMYCYTVQSQTIINGQAYTFDDQSLDGWTTENLSSTNFGEWQWKENGKADGGTYWNDRDSIRSTSLGGAAVYDSDGLFSVGIGNALLPVEVALNSPVLNFSGEPNVYLKFNQYFRNYQTDTRVEVSIDNGMTWTIFNLNDNVNQNVETSSGDYKVIDISTPAAGVGEVRVRFVFSGDYYFWILDDVEFWDGYPYPQTFPAYVGDSLVAFNVAYEVDESAWPHRPNEMVVQFKEGTPFMRKEELRDSFGVVLYDSCVCNRLELWRMGDDVFSGGDTLSNFGGNIGLLENVKGSKSQSEIDGSDFNRLNYNELRDSVIVPNQKLQTIPSNASTPSANATLVAILDTGIDYDHPNFDDFIALNNDDLGNDIDDDGNCQNDDPVGWNFVNNNNNVFDNHGHGTHVAGIIQNNLTAYNFNSCDIKIVPYKTHNYQGIGDLFAVTCATYQALEDEVSVINDSWGFYGDSSIILSNAIDTVRNYDILVITASGNDTLDLVDYQQYPACYFNENIITVGAHDTTFIDVNFYDTLVAPFSNYSPNYVDILAPGSEILSTLPGNQMGAKNGTSMATPAVSAVAAIYYCDGVFDFQAVKDSLINCSKNHIDLAGEALDGNVLYFDAACLTTVGNLDLGNDFEYLIYPNPTQDRIFISPNQQMEDVKIQLINMSGQPVFQKEIKYWDRNSIQQFDVKKLPSGIYFFKVQFSSYIWTYKMIKT
jgi:subtilisin family serine protease